MCTGENYKKDIYIVKPSPKSQNIFGSVRSSRKLILVRPSVCLMKSVLELTIIIFLYQSQVSLRSVSGQSQVRFGDIFTFMDKIWD